MPLDDVAADFPALQVILAHPSVPWVLFGSDYPVLTPERWLSDFEQLDIKDEVRPLILKENAARLLDL
jgi:predicted TIM-barrel fold metal-dependent hydrolase